MKIAREETFGRSFQIMKFSSETRRCVSRTTRSTASRRRSGPPTPSSRIASRDESPRAVSSSTTRLHLWSVRNAVAGREAERQDDRPDRGLPVRSGQAHQHRPQPHVRATHLWFPYSKSYDLMAFAAKAVSKASGSGGLVRILSSAKHQRSLSRRELPARFTTSVIRPTRLRNGSANAR